MSTTLKTRFRTRSQERYAIVTTIWRPGLTKGCFRLGGIFPAERHFLLCKDQLAESLRQETKENIIPRVKFRLVENDPKIKLRIKISPEFSLLLIAYSYRLFKKFNRAPLKYSLGGLCRFPCGGYIHAALETV